MDNQELISADSQVLPFSLEAEQAVLGAVLIDPDIISDVAEIIKPEHFYLPQHIAIANAIWAMDALSKKIDSITVLEELKKEKVFDDAGGKAYLLQLAQIVPTSANAVSYAKIIKEKHYVRSLILAARKIISEASESEVDADLLLDSAEQTIYEIRQNRDEGGLVHIKKVITGETFDRLDKITKEEYREDFIGIPSGISAIDKFTTGFHKSDLIILGARPGMGKTSLALNFARNVALNSKKCVAFFSLEMTREQLAERLIASEAAIPSVKFRTGELDTNEWSRLAQASGILSECNIFLDETPSITVAEIKARLRRLNPKPDLVIIDYLGLMQSTKYKDNRVLQIQDITGNLKVMAKELNIPIICCSQLARSTEARGKSHKPQLADLRDSGSIEQDADIVMFIYRDIYYQAESENPEEINANAAECIIAKNRHGEVGTAKLNFDAQFTRFTTPDYSHEEQ
ncbi:MAG: replicative DNA helicase [Acutalibacteraceae bacterium]